MIEQKDPQTLIYLDETGIDDNEVYPYAWGPKGSRVYGMKHAERNRRLSIMSALHHKEIKAPFVFEGSCTRDVFEVYLEKVLVPELKPGQTIILDNASFHKGGRIVDLIKSADCEVLYLPPYSPDFNPIEHCWSPIKNRLRKHLQPHDRDLFKAAEITFQQIIP